MKVFIKNRENIKINIINNIKDKNNWHFGYQKKSHYALNEFNEIIGCLNLIFLFKIKKYHIFYLDTIEVKKDLRKRQIGTKLLNFVLNSVENRYRNSIFYLLVVKCEQYKLKFFSKHKFTPIKLRKNVRGTHCIMTFPLIKYSEKIANLIFRYFHWRTEHVEILSSDCKYAYNPNPTGLYWCDKKKIFVTGMEKQNCPFYIKEQEFYSKEKYLDLSKNILNKPKSSVKFLKQEKIIDY